MADDLKRVGLKFTADGARDFKSELKECSAATKENYSELKLAQSQYDKNTSSVKKLEDRQKYLAKQTEVYSDKTKILKGQLDEMEKAENRDEAAIAKKRAELNQAEAKLNEYEKSLEDVNKQLDSHSAQLQEWGGKIQDAGGKVKGVGDAMQSFGGTLTTHVTAPIAGVGAAAVASFNEVDAAYDNLVVKTGATGDELTSLQGIVDNLATSMPTSFQTASDAVGELATRFDLPSDKLQTLSEAFIKFADINNTDVTSSVDGVQKALSAFGQDAEHAGPLLDVLNRTGQETGVSMDALLNGLVQNSAAFQELGLSIDQSTVFMGQLEKSGANGETVMNGLRKALKQATKDGIPLNQALADLQNTIQNGSGSVDGLTAAYDLFGKSGDQIYAAVKNGSLDFTDLASSQDILAESANSVAKTYEGTLDPMDQMKMAMNDAKLIGMDIVTTAAPMIKDIMEVLRDIITDLKDKWNGLSEEQQQNIIKIAGIVAVVGPLITILGSVISTVGSIIMGIGVLVPLLGTIGPPIMIIIGVIMAVIAAGGLLVQNWDTIKAAAGKFVDGVKKNWETLKTNTVEKFNKIREGIAGPIEKARDLAGKAIEKIRDTAVSIWETVKSNTIDKFNAIRDGIMNPIEKARDFVGKAIDKIKGFFDFKWSLPKLKLPHFSFTGAFSLDPPSVPHFSVEWYKKAMGGGMILNGPTIFGAQGNKLLGGGEAGSETVVGTRSLMEMIQDAVRGAWGGGSGSAPAPITVTYGDVHMNIYASPEQDVKELAEEVLRRLSQVYDREKEVWA